MRMFNVCIACCVLSVACTGENQEREMLLYEARASDPNLVPVQGPPFSNGITIGPEGKPVPLRIRWTAGRDSTNCLRIASLRVERNGGDPSVVISNVKHAAIACGMEWESPDTTRFETALINLRYHTRTGLKTYDFRGAVAHVTGTGEIVPTLAERTGD